MDNEEKPEGPDLTLGVPLEDLPEGGTIVGHANGENVLLARVGEELFAIGATCTHYGGPLGEGLRVDDTVRCPWHHACFSLRTGKALRAPALNPVARYRVERDGDRIFVRSKIEPEGSGGPSDGNGTVVIVGAGAAGEATAEKLRREGFGGRIVLIGAEEALPADRPNLSKDYLAGSAPEEWIPLHPAEFYDEMRIELLRGARVTSIDPDAKRIVLRDGAEPLAFDTLVLATGADPVRLTIPGADAPHVSYLRSFADSRAIIARAERSQNAVVIGASFIGLEVAASLRKRGIDVVVVGPESVPLERVMGREVGEFIRHLHESHGVVFRLGQKPVEITDRGVVLESGEVLPADLVVVGIGVKPNTALAEAAGLRVDNGVIVDEQLKTSKPDIFAVGDVARWPDPRSGNPIRVEHWVVAQRQGETAAYNILGRKRPFDAVPFFWSQHYETAIAFVGHNAGWDEVKLDGNLAESDARIVFRSAGRIVAVATIFRDLESLKAELAIERGDDAALEAIAGS